MAGQTVADYALVVCGLALQTVVYMIARDGVLSLVCGLIGVLSVTLCSQRKLSSFAFGVVQIMAYLVISVQQRFYGEMVENLFYLTTTVAGAIVWSRHYDEANEGNQVVSRRLTAKGWTLIALLAVAGTAGTTWLLRATQDPNPLLDAVSSVPAVIAQVLMMLRYREQWLFWLVVDGLKAAMWIVAGNWSMAALFGFWTLVCVYGFFKWK